jgi:hypothetical protein
MIFLKTGTLAIILFVALVSASPTDRENRALRRSSRAQAARHQTLESANDRAVAQVQQARVEEAIPEASRPAHRQLAKRRTRLRAAEEARLRAAEEARLQATELVEEVAVAPVEAVAVAPVEEVAVAPVEEEAVAPVEEEAVASVQRANEMLSDVANSLATKFRSMSAGQFFLSFILKKANQKPRILLGPSDNPHPRMDVIALMQCLTSDDIVQSTAHLTEEEKMIVNHFSALERSGMDAALIGQIARFHEEE